MFSTIPPPKPMVQYDPRSGQFQDDQGNPLPSNFVDELITQDQARTARRLENLTLRLQFEPGYTLSRYQADAAQIIKEQGIRLTALGAGGLASLLLLAQRNRFKPFAPLRDRLERHAFPAIRELGNRLIENVLSVAQTLDRARRLAIHGRIQHSETEQITKAGEGRAFAIRLLDPAVDHCPSCPLYQQLQPVPIDQIVPIGTACECGGYCHCQVRLVGPRANPLQSRRLVDAVLESQQTREGIYDPVT